jgi:L-lysine 6-transaminase
MTIKGTEVRDIIAKNMLADGLDQVFDEEKSHGTTFVDARDGREYIDLFSCFASMPVGFNHPKMNNPEFIQKIGKVALNKISLSDIYTSAMAEFVEVFTRVAKPEEMKYLFWVEGGGLAVENAMKTAMDWKMKLNRMKGDTRGKGSKIVHFREAFHGRTGYTMSVTNTDPTKTDLFAKFDWPRIDNPKMIFPIDENLDEVLEAEAMALDQLEVLMAVDAADIAAILIEPIQGEGGDNQFRDEFFAELRAIADENDVLLIFDEVQTGIGLTGKMWAYQNYSIVPDIVCMGKKTQVCGIMATDRIDNVPDHVFRTSSRLNSTWGGNIVDMVRSAKYLEIIEEEKLVDNVNAVAPVLMDGLNALMKDYPELISNVRGVGLFAAFDIATPEQRGDLVGKMWDNGALILPCGINSIRFRPSLNITAETIKEALKIIRKSIEEIK